MTMKEMSKNILANIETETLLRKWQRRLIVALDDAEKQKCKAKINEYSYRINRATIKL